MQVSTSLDSTRRVLAALPLPGTVRVGLVSEPVRRMTTGVLPLDTVLGGGLPCGRLSELAGPVTSGKTAMVLAFLAAATQRGEVTALIDLPDALHPEAAQSAGVELTRLLWVRPPSLHDGLRCAELLLEAGGFGLIALDLGESTPRQFRAPVWPRLARAAQRSQTALAVVADRRVIDSSAAMSLTLTASHRQWSRGAWPLFEGIRFQLTVTRNKLGSPGRHITVRAVRSADFHLPLSPFCLLPSAFSLLPSAF